MTGLKTWKEFLKEEDGMGTVEIILIVIVLVGLVIIFKDYIEDFVLSIMDKIDAKAKIF